MNSFYNPYMVQGNYMTELQNMRDRIDNQIQQVQHQQQNMQQPANVTQNFQLTPNVINNIKFANNIEDVKKEIVVADTYFYNKEMTDMWIKNAKGDIRTFEIKEIIPKTEKDLLIEKLQNEIEELKRGNISEYDKSNGNQLSKQSSSEFDKPVREQIATIEPTDVSNLSSSKTTKRKSE